MKSIPTINKLSYKLTGAKNEYGERCVTICAESYEGATTRTNPKPFLYTPYLANLTFGIDEQERIGIAQDIINRCNNHETMFEALQEITNRAETALENFAIGLIDEQSLRNTLGAIAEFAEQTTNRVEPKQEPLFETLGKLLNPNI